MKIPILMYHRVEETGDGGDPRYAVAPGMFRRQMDYLVREGYTPVNLDGLTEDKGLSVPRPVVITFDDGYLDNYENAVPVLCSHGFHATVFVISDLIGKESRWINGAEGFKKPLMGWREIEEITRFGITIGSHTKTHRRLSQLLSDEAEVEIVSSKQVLEDKLGFEIKHFAYPYGDYNQKVRKLVESAVYKTASTTASGFNTAETNIYELRRIDVFGVDSLKAFSIKLALGTNDGSIAHLANYYIRRLTG